MRRALFKSLIIDPLKMPKKMVKQKQNAQGDYPGGKEEPNTHSRVHVQEAGNRKRIFHRALVLPTTMGKRQNRIEQNTDGYYIGGALAMPLAGQPAGEKKKKGTTNGPDQN